MTNKEFVAELAKRLDWTQTRTAMVVEEVVELMGNNLAAENTINIQGFGAFEARFKKERVSVNPVSKQRFLVPPKITPAFRPGQTLKDKLKNL